jgi:hypothetical protein
MSIDTGNYEENSNSLYAHALSSQLMPALKVPKIRNYEMADYQYEVIMQRIKEFEEVLDDEHEVAIQLASFGKYILLNVTDIGYSNPNTIVFYGFVNGQNATLIQHMSMLSFLLLAVRKPEPEKPARRIGFFIDEDK